MGNRLSFILVFLIGPLFFASFSGFQGVNFLGELSSDLFTYLYFISAIPAMCFFYGKKSIIVNKDLFFFFIVFFLIIIVSGILNIDGILSSEIRYRSGLNKFFTSTFVFLYAFCVSWYFYCVISYFISIKKELYLLRWVWFSFLCLLPINVMEIFDWFLGLDLMGGMKSIYFSGTYYSVDGRLRGMSAEPSFYSNFLVFVFTILIVYWKDLPLGKLGVPIVFLCIILTNSRTAYLCTCFILFFYYTNKFKVNFFCKNNSIFIVLFVLFTFIFLFIYSDYLGWYFADSDNTSNLSRLSSIYNALLIFKDNMFVGVGFGQYAFNAFNYLSMWSEESYEILRWFYDDDFTWPPSFSLHSRILSELGVFGYIFFVGYFVKLEKKLILSEKLFGINKDVQLCRLLIVYCIITSYSFDSFRNPYFWFSFSYVCFYLSKRRFSYGS